MRAKSDGHLSRCTMGESTYPAPYIRTYFRYVRVLMVSPGRSDGAARVSKLEASDLLVECWVTGSISSSPSIQKHISKVSRTYIGHTEIMICMGPQVLRHSGNRTMESRRRSQQQGIILH